MHPELEVIEFLVMNLHCKQAILTQSAAHTYAAHSADSEQRASIIHAGKFLAEMQALI